MVKVKNKATKADCATVQLCTVLDSTNVRKRTRVWLNDRSNLQEITGLYLDIIALCNSTMMTFDLSLYMSMWCR